MSEAENFLSRWLRRKQDVAESQAEHARQVKAPAVAEQVPSSNTSETAAPDRAKGSAESESLFDLKTLPPLDSITAGTDIRAFLAPGVPPDLARAALRRAWTADPAIRDYIGPADYAWDYHTPGSMPGFGPLQMTDELRQVVARIFGAVEPGQAPTIGEHHATQSLTTADPQVHGSPLGLQRSDTQAGDQKSPPDGIGMASSNAASAACDKETPAAQTDSKTATAQPARRRSHGTALPR